MKLEEKQHAVAVLKVEATLEKEWGSLEECRMPRIVEGGLAWKPELQTQGHSLGTGLCQQPE